MDLLKETIKICRANNIKPARSRGQNFLINEDIYNNIIETSDLKKDDIVLEVGPGLGFLTEKLALRVKKVIAVELDKNLANILNISLKEKGINNVEIVNNNILDYNTYNFINDYKIVANIPYNITSIFLRKFLSDAEKKPKLMVLMIQKEVAERIIARPPRMSLLALSVQFYSKPEILEIVLKNNFWPQPEVDSAIIKLIIPPSARQPCERTGNYELLINLPKNFSEKDFFKILKFGFSAKRKMLKNNLAGGLHISNIEAENIIKKAGLEVKVRAQELSLENWVKIFEIVYGNMV